MAQQTAVEWLAKNMEKLIPPGNQIVISIWIDKAKWIEKEQIKKAVDIGFDEGCKHPEDRTLRSAEQYYNETYGKP